MALKTALSHFLYSVVRFSNRLLMMFPGNMGNGIRSEAARKIVRKTIKMGVPFNFSPGAFKCLKNLNI